VCALIGLVTLTLELVRFIAHMVGNIGINFGISGTFYSRVMGQRLSDGPRDFSTLTFGSVKALVGGMGLGSPSV